MEAGTKALRAQKRKETQAFLEETLRQDRLDRLLQKRERLKAQQLRARKLEARDEVREAASRAIERLNQNDGEGWVEEGELKKVCLKSGPHSGIWCFLHRRKVGLVKIPNVWQQDDVKLSSHLRKQIMYFYLGADGHIYRDGRTKIYRAQLIERDWPSEITVVSKQIDTIYTP